MNPGKFKIATWIRHRWKKLLLLAGVSLGALVALFLIVNAILIARTGAQLEKRIDALRAAGDPVTLNDLADPPVPAENNAAVFLRRAEADVEAIVKELRPIEESQPFKDGRLGEAEQKALKAVFAAYPRFVSDLEKAAACTSYNSEADFSVGPQSYTADVMLPQSNRFRGCINALSDRSLLLVSEGRLEEALQNCLVILRLGDHYEREPFLINYFVSLAARAVAVKDANLILRAGPVSPASRSALAAELARGDSSQAFEHALKTERVYGLEMSRDMIGGVNRWMVNDLQSTLIDMIDEELKRTSPPFTEVEAPAWQADHWSMGVALARLSDQAVAKARTACWRSRARFRCLRVLLALQDETGRKKEQEPKITDLGLPKEVITDPFSGEPLRLKKSAAGWTIYSVGPDGVDDGGDLTEEKDVGVGPVPGGKL
jgi:hypothetical protein